MGFDLEAPPAQHPPHRRARARRLGGGAGLICGALGFAVMALIVAGMSSQEPVTLWFGVPPLAVSLFGCWKLGQFVGEVVLGGRVWNALRTGLWAGAVGSMIVTMGSCAAAWPLHRWLDPTPSPFGESLMLGFFLGLYGCVLALPLGLFMGAVLHGLINSD